MTLSAEIWYGIIDARSSTPPKDAMTGSCIDIGAAIARPMWSVSLTPTVEPCDSSVARIARPESTQDVYLLHSLIERDPVAKETLSAEELWTHSGTAGTTIVLRTH